MIRVKLQEKDYSFEKLKVPYLLDTPRSNLLGTPRPRRVKKGYKNARS